MREVVIPPCRHASPRTVQVWKAKVGVEMKPWRRLDVGGTPHNHGFIIAVRNPGLRASELPVALWFELVAAVCSQGCATG